MQSYRTLSWTLLAVRLQVVVCLKLFSAQTSDSGKHVCVHRLELCLLMIYFFFPQKARYCIEKNFSNLYISISKTQLPPLSFSCFRLSSKRILTIKIHDSQGFSYLALHNDRCDALL